MSRRKVKPLVVSHGRRHALANARARMLAECQHGAPDGGWAVGRTGHVEGTLTCAACGSTGPARFRLTTSAERRLGRVVEVIRVLGDWQPPLSSPTCPLCMAKAPRGTLPGGEGEQKEITRDA